MDDAALGIPNSPTKLCKLLETLCLSNTKLIKPVKENAVDVSKRQVSAHSGVERVVVGGKCLVLVGVGSKGKEEVGDSCIRATLLLTYQRIPSNRSSLVALRV